MAKKKEEETALAAFDEVADLMAVDDSAQRGDGSEGGLGAEDLDAGVVTLPRVTVLQSMSKVITQSDDDEPPVAGTLWLSPFNRPVGGPKTPARIVVVKIFHVQRLWTPLSEGGGLICEAPSGKMIARESAGLSGAVLSVDEKDGVVEALEWSGGTPTNDCRSCVYGPGASAAVGGASGKGGGWLPKFFTHEGRRLTVPDRLRAPRCQGGIDALVLVAAPQYRGQPADIIPAFISFARTGLAAGKSLAGMIKMSPRQPAWGKLFELGVKRVTNDSGTFFIPTIQVLGATKPALMERARSLYDAANETEFRSASDDDVHDVHDAGAEPVRAASGPVGSEDEPEIGDQF